MSKEQTFRLYNSAQASHYRQHRRGYHPVVYETILRYHQGAFEKLVDVGCGVGNATADMAPHFNNVIGVDPSEGMLQEARKSEIASKSGKPAIFVKGEAEALHDLKELPPHSVDLIMAATAAHWFPAGFWDSAAEILKPDGTIALWGRTAMSCHPSTPNHAGIQAALDNLEHNLLDPYMLPGNRICANAYRDLPKPWEVGCDAFDQTKFQHIIFDQGGKPSGDDGNFESGQLPLTLEQLKAAISTASPLTRWREDHPELTGTSQDVLEMTIHKVAELLGDSTKTILCGCETFVLLFKLRSR